MKRGASCLADLLRLLPSGLHAPLSAPCAQRVWASFLGGGVGGRYLEAQTGQARWEMVYWSSLYEVLMW